MSPGTFTKILSNDTDTPTISRTRSKKQESACELLFLGERSTSLSLRRDDAGEGRGGERKIEKERKKRKEGRKEKEKE